MNLTPLFEIQTNVDFVISNKLNIDLCEREFINKRIHAFKVEVSEFSNEVGWFKYWKQSHEMDKDKAIEELADCMAFLLSIGLSMNYHKFIKNIKPSEWDKVPMESLFSYLFKNELQSSDDWKTAFEHLISIGLKLGFSLVEIELSYYAKSGTNVERQRVNY